jgi:hypothetical protein
MAASEAASKKFRGLKLSMTMSDNGEDKERLWLLQKSLTFGEIKRRFTESDWQALKQGCGAFGIRETETKIKELRRGPGRIALVHKYLVRRNGAALDPISSRPL